MSHRSRVPQMVHHKQSGRALVSLPDGCGGRKQIMLGTWGTPEAEAEYARVIAEWLAANRQLPGTILNSPDLTVNELIARLWQAHVIEHYRRPDGSQTAEVGEYRLTFRTLRQLYGYTAARDFGPAALKAVRQSFIAQDLCRNTVNQRTGRIRRLFKWAVENELLAEPVYRALLLVPDLEKGRSAARETPKVPPVPDTVVDATLPFLPPQLQAAVRVQRLTGMRPGEALLLRGRDLDTSRPTWEYRPHQHKTAHHDQQRVIFIGPKAQEVLRPWLRPDPDAYLFQPREAMALRHAQRRKARRTRLQPSQQYRRVARPRRAPGSRYTDSAYGHAVTKACKAAFPPPGELARRKVEAKRGWRWETDEEWQARLGPERWAEKVAWEKAHHWHPHQVRHTAATELRRAVNVEDVCTILGQRSLAVTEIYAERDAAGAAEIMSRLG